MIIWYSSWHDNFPLVSLWDFVGYLIINLLISFKLGVGRREWHRSLQPPPPTTTGAIFQQPPLESFSIYWPKKENKYTNHTSTTFPAQRTSTHSTKKNNHSSSSLKISGSRVWFGKPSSEWVNSTNTYCTKTKSSLIQNAFEKLRVKRERESSN